MPVGPTPTGIVANGTFVAVAIAVTVLSGPFTTYRVAPSGVTARRVGLDTGMVVTDPVRISTTDTTSATASETYTCLSSGCTATASRKGLTNGTSMLAKFEVLMIFNEL